MQDEGEAHVVDAPASAGADDAASGRKQGMTASNLVPVVAMPAASKKASNSSEITFYKKYYINSILVHSNAHTSKIHNLNQN